jgi:mono/diheme cytochrome c family protein
MLLLQAATLTGCLVRGSGSGPDETAVPSADNAPPRGAALYTEHCASCHGPNGEGQPNWKVPGEDGLLPAPPHDSTGHTWHHPDAVLLQIIAQGGTLYSPKSNMPGFASVLTAAEMQEVLDYIKSWWGPQELTYQQDRTRESLAVPPAPSP